MECDLAIPLYFGRETAETEAGDAQACLPSASGKASYSGEWALGRCQADARLWPRLSLGRVSIRKLCLQLCVLESQTTALNFSRRGCVLKGGLTARGGEAAAQGRGVAVLLRGWLAAPK